MVESERGMVVRKRTGMLKEGEQQKDLRKETKKR